MILLDLLLDLLIAVWIFVTVRSLGASGLYGLVLLLYKLGLIEERTDFPRAISGKGPEEIIWKAGGEYVGIQPGEGHIPDQVLFNDPETRSTLALPRNQITVGRVRAQMNQSRAKFAAEGQGKE